MSIDTKPAKAAIPPYLPVASITNPGLQVVPPLESFQVLEGDERPIKSYRIRVRRPKVPWLLVLLAMVIVAPALVGLTMLYQARLQFVKVRVPVEHSFDEESRDMAPTALPQQASPLEQQSTPQSQPPDSSAPDAPRSSDHPSDSSTPEDLRPSDRPPRVSSPFDPSQSSPGPTAPGQSPAAPPFDPSGNGKQLLQLADAGQTTGSNAAAQDFEEQTEIERGEPSNPWLLLVVWELITVGAVIGSFIALRARGHTFLYLTNRRLIVLELAQSLWAKEQTLLNFNVRDISGFQLLAQRGLRKLFGVLLLRDKRTFYLSIATRTSCNVEIGAVSSRRSQFEPGGDAVALCGELDAQVLALRTAGNL